MNVDEIAKERCRKLIELAKGMWKEDSKLALRYVKLARKIAMKHRFPLGSKDFCRKCNTPFIPGVTVKVRLQSRQKTALYICGSCNTTRKFPYSRKRN